MDESLWHNKEGFLEVDEERLPRTDEMAEQFWVQDLNQRRADLSNRTFLEMQGADGDQIVQDFENSAAELSKIESIRDDNRYPLQWLPAFDDQRHGDEFIEFYKDVSNAKAANKDYDGVNDYFRHHLDKKYTERFIPEFLQGEYAAKKDYDGAVEQLSNFLSTADENLPPAEYAQLRDKFVAEVESSKKQLTTVRVDRYDSIDQQVDGLNDKISTLETKLQEVSEEDWLRTAERMTQLDFEDEEDIQAQIAKLTEQRDYYTESKNLLQLVDSGGLTDEAVESSYGKVPGDTPEDRVRNYYMLLLSAWEDHVGEHRSGGGSVLEEIGKFWDFVSTGPEGIGFKELEKRLAVLAPVVSLQRSPIEADDTAIQVFGKSFASAMLPKAAPSTAQDLALQIENSLAVAGAKMKDDVYSQSINKIGSPYEHFSDKDWASMIGLTTAIMSQMLLSDPLYGKMKKITKLNKFLDEGVGTGALYNRGGEAYQILGNTKFGRGVTKAIFSGVDEGLKFETAGNIFEQSEDELNFWSGFFGGAMASPVTQALDSEATKKLVYSQLTKLFGGKTDDAVSKIYQYGEYVQGAGKTLVGRPHAEVWEEFGNELGNILKDSDGYDDVREKIVERFGDKDDLFHFAVSSYMMGLGFGATGSIGQAGIFQSKKAYDRLSPEDQKDFRDLLSEISDEIQAAEEQLSTDEGTESDTDKQTTSVDDAGATVSDEGEVDSGVVDDSGQADNTPEETGPDSPASEPDRASGQTISDERLENLSSEENDRLTHLEGNVVDYLSNQDEYAELFEKAHGQNPFDTTRQPDKFNAELRDGELIVVDLDGDEVTSETDRREFFKQYFRQNSNVGERAHEALEREGEWFPEDYQSDVDYAEAVAVHSNNPREIVEEYVHSIEREGNVSLETVLSPKEVAIHTHFRSISEKELKHYTGYGKADFGKSRGVLKNSKNVGSVDTWAQEASDEFDNSEDSITTDDVIEYILNNADGVNSKLNEGKVREGELRADLEERFKAVAGTKLTPTIIDASLESTLESVGVDSSIINDAIEQEFDSLDQLEEYYKDQFEKYEGLNEEKLSEVFENRPSIGGNEVAEESAEYSAEKDNKKVASSKRKVAKSKAKYKKKVKRVSSESATGDQSVVDLDAKQNQEEITKQLAKDRRALDKELRRYADIIEGIDADTRAQKSKESIDNLDDGATESFEQDIDDALDGKIEYAHSSDESVQEAFDGDVAKVISALKKLVPGLEVIVSKDQKSYEDAAVRMGAKKSEAQSTSAFFTGEKIYINLAKAGDSTLFHEGAHPVVAALLMKDPSRVDEFYDTIASDPALKQYVDYGKNHPSPTADGRIETITEFLADVAAGKLPSEMKVGTLDKIKALIQRLFDALGLKINLTVNLQNESDLRSFAGKLALAFQTGMTVKGLDEEIRRAGLEFQGDERSLFDRLKHAVVKALRSGLSEDHIKETLKSKTDLDATEIDALVGNSVEHYFNDDVSAVPKSEATKRLRHKLMYRLQEFGELTEDETALFNEGDLNYDVVGWNRMNEKVAAFFTELQGSANVVVAYDHVFDAIKQISLDDWVNNKELASFTTFVLQRLASEHRKTNRLVEWKEVFTWLSDLSNRSGQQISALQQGSSAESLANRATDKALNDLNDQLGKDGVELMTELHAEIRNLRKELDNEISKNTILDKIIARRVNDTTKNSGMDVRYGPRKSKTIDKKIRKIIAHMSDAADSPIPVDVMKGALLEVSKTIASQKTLVEAVQAGTNYLKFTDWYGQFDTVQRRAELASFRSQVSDIIGLSSIVKTEIQSKARSLKLKVGDLVKSHLNGDNSNRNDLIDKLIDETGLTKQEAVEYVRILEQEFDKILRPGLKKFLGDKLSSDSTLIVDQTPEARDSAIDKLIQLINSGALNDHSMKDAFSDMFGLKSVSPEVIATINQLAKLAIEFGDSGQIIQQRRIVNQMIRLIKQNSRKDAEFWYSLLNDFLHMNALSGISTQFNANFGLFLSAMPEMISYSVMNSPSSIMFALNQALSKDNFKSIIASVGSAIAHDRSAYDQYNSYIDGRTSNDYSSLSDFIVHGISDSLEKARIRTQAGPNLAVKERLKLVAASVAQGYRMVFMLKAADAAFADFATEYIQGLDAYKSEMNKAGIKFIKNPFKALENHKALSDLAKEAMGTTDARKAAVHRQVDLEIEELAARNIKTDVGYRASRVKEVINESRDRRKWQRAVEMAKEFALLGKPKGGFGLFYRGVENILTPNFYSEAHKADFRQMSKTQKAATLGLTGLRLMGRGMFMFMRLMMNTGTKLVDNTPIIGQLYLLGARYGGLRLSLESGQMFEKMPHDEFARKMIISTTMSAVMGGLMAHMFDFEESDDEDEFKTAFSFLGTKYNVILNPDRLIDVTTSLSGNYSKDQTGSPGERPFSIRWRSSPDKEWSKPIKYVYAPHLVPALSYLGYIRDKSRYDRNGVQMNPMSGLMGTLEATTELTFAASLQTAKQSFFAAQADDDSKWLVEMAKGYGAKPLVTVAQPNFARDIYEFIQHASGEVKPEGLNSWEDFGKGIMYVQSVFDFDAVDMFGYPIEYENKLKRFDVLGLLTEDYWQEHSAGKKEWDLVYKFEDLMIEKPRKPSLSALKDTFGINSKLSEDEKSIIQMKSNVYFGELIRSEYDALDSVEESHALEKALGKLKGVAQKLALVDFYEMYKADNRDDYETYMVPNMEHFHTKTIIVGQ